MTSGLAGNTNPRVFYKNLEMYEKAFIAGTVAEADTDECAEGVEVRLLNERGLEVAVTRTDIFGDFRLRGLKKGLTGLSLVVETEGRRKHLQVDFRPGLNLGTILI